MTRATPRRGEIWLVDLNPTLGAEMGKLRPALVVGRDALARLPLRLVVPITSWQPRFAALPWMVRIEPSPHNGLHKTSAVDTLQIRALDLRRFRRRLGALTPEQMRQVAAGLRLVLDLGPAPGG